MAENKRGFLLYTDLIHISEKLSDAKAGRLFKHILRYVNDMNPEAPDEITELIFEPIKLQLKRDLDKWQNEIRPKRSEAGKLGGIKSGEARRSKTKQNEANASNVKQNEANASNVKQNEANEAVNVNVNVNVNDIDINKLNNLNAVEVFFQIQTERILGKPSEFADKNFKKLVELNLMQHKISVSEWASNFDAEYQFKSFTNERHFQNAISSTFKKIKSLTYAKTTTAATTAIDSGRIKDLSGAKF